MADHGNFPTTSWAMLVAARDDEQELVRVLSRYRPAMIAWFRRRGHRDADEITDDFIRDVFWGRDLLGVVDPDSGGRFRSFLQKCIRNYRVDRHRSSRTESMRTERLDGREVATAADPDDAFEVAWVMAIANEALDRARTRLDASDPRAWSVFEMQRLGPAVGRAAARPMSDVATELGLSDAASASRLLYRARAVVSQQLRDIVAETVSDPALLDDELAWVGARLGVDLRHGDISSRSSTPD